MSGNFKIRLLLLMLAAGFACTALTINFTVDKSEILYLDGQKIERRLHRAETVVDRFLNRTDIVDSLKSIDSNPDWARYLITEFGENRGILIQTYEHGKLKFWNDTRIILETDSYLREGSSFLPWENGYYEAVKKSFGTLSVVAFIPVMAKYPYQNRYLTNEFSKELLKADHLDIASLNDRQVFNVRNLAGKYLFSVKLKSVQSGNLFLSLELWMWVLGAICLLTFVTHLCVSLAERGKVIPGICLLTGFLFLLRLLDLEYRWLGDHFDLEIFNPKHFAASYFLPSIGELFINVVSLTWILVFVHAYRFKLVRPGMGRTASIALLVLLILFICIFGLLINDIFYGLITNSNINFDVNNVLNSTWVSWMAAVIYCFAGLNLFLLIYTCLAVSDELSISTREKMIVFGAVLGIVFLVRLLTSDLSVYFLLFSSLLIISAWAFYRYNKKLNPGVLVVCLLIFAVIGSVKLSRFQYLKERDSRKIIAKNLESSADPNAVLLFLNIEQEIVQDNFISDYFNNPLASHSALSNRLVKLYLAGYLSRYDFKAYEYDEDDRPIRSDSGVPLSRFKNLVLKGSVKVSGYFYQKNNTFGFQHYFALLPIQKENSTIGTLVLELSSKRLDQMDAFPELLVEGKVSDDGQLSKYSFAYYSDDLLLNQHGDYVYNVKNSDFDAELKSFKYLNNFDKGKEYSHLVYRPNDRKLIVVSTEIKGLLYKLSSASFIFLVLLTFSGLVYLLQLIWYGIHNYPISYRNFRWSYLIATNRMLYKTRIQVSMVSAVVFTLLITGLITFYNISQQYREQQASDVLNRLAKISGTFGNNLLSDELMSGDEKSEVAFNNFAELNGADLNLFGLDGSVIHSTQPKIYENSLVGKRMDAKAFLYLNTLQKSEYIGSENIGELSFMSAYIPLRNEKNEPIAYLGLPYFSNESDYWESIGAFLNALINVYALVFVAIGFIAVFVANKITSPLTLVQKSLSETKIGRKNEPILWKRNDEIGNLIREYNMMIAALEESAQKLARSERETAWREMAKQVAHEIKNPLTPLKLGVQLLEKSWREKDPKFDLKFEKFSKSFIEQIESLAHIASEFSNFAKMPDTVLQGVLLQDVLETSMATYKDSDHAQIEYTNNCDRAIFVNGDRDQLLRCFNNILKNSVEARKDGERIRIDILLYCDDHHVGIDIADSGTGIAESLREQIFTPNFTTKSSGTGLGLAFVKQAIENMEGHIRFETSPGKGTTFYITIPILKNLTNKPPAS